MKTLRMFILGLALTVIAVSSFAQKTTSRNDEYSLMIFNFAKYIQWPENKEKKNFVICIVGNSEIYKTLSSWYWGTPSGYQDYIIRNCKQASEAIDCQLIFIDASKSNEFETVNSTFKGKSTLVVTDSTGLGAKGSCINFKRNGEEKLQFELNHQAIASSNLKVTDALARIAIVL